MDIHCGLIRSESYSVLQSVSKYRQHQRSNCPDSAILYIVLTIMVSFFINTPLTAQDENAVWGVKKPVYNVPEKSTGKEYNLTFDSVTDFFTVPIIYTYWYSISGPDGDHCPFHPSCSTFLIQGIKETTILTGVLLFFDRFTRDANFVNRREHYPIIKNGKLFDAPSVYMLDGSGNGSPYFEEYMRLMENSQ